MDSDTVNVKSVSPASPSAWATSLMDTYTAGPVTRPVIEKLKGFSSASLLPITICPANVPIAPVFNCTVNVSEAPAAKLDASGSVTV